MEGEHFGMVSEVSEEGMCYTIEQSSNEEDVILQE
jgi:hypothetical protein